MAALRFLRRFCRRLAPPALLALLVLLDGAPAFASPARTLRFDHLSVEHGLAQESVLDIVQDADGFMWFGSQTGLSRFDGYRVTVYRNEIGRSTSLANNWVRVLHVDRRGRLWVGTDGGLDLFEPDSGHFIHFVPNEPDMRGSGNRHIRAIVDDGAHGLWLATGDGLQHFDMERKVFTPFHHVPADSSSLADDQLNALALDASGRLWVGTASGLDSLARGASSFEHHPLARTGPGERSVEALLVDRAQRLWIGSPGGLAVTRLDRRPLAPRQFGAAEGMRPGGVDVLYQDPQGTLWAGSRNYGLYQWQEGAGRFLNYRHQLTDNHSLSDNQIASIFRDRVGTFWVGTWYAGVNRVDLGSGGFARIVDAADSPEAVDDNKVRVMLDDGAGKLWVGTNGGLRHLDPVSGEGRMYRHQPADPHSLPGPAASALARDSSGQLWVGSRDGIASVDPSSGRFNRQSLSPGEPDGDNVRAMLGDRAGALWVATRGGLHRFDPRTRKIVTYRHDPEDSASLADNMVRPLLEDRRGRFWVGTFNGLDLLDRTTGKFTHYRHDPNNPRSLSHDEVHYLMEDRHGALWVGTALGVNKMVEAADGSIGFERYTARDGLADDAVAAILEDADGHLWISSSTGLSRFSPATNRWRTFSAGDGTIEGAYFDASALRGADGSLYFGGFNGITAFDPKAITDNLYAPRAVITGIQVANRPLAASEQGRLEMPVAGPAELTLDAADSVFSLEFSALHFAAPARNRFAYQLVGFDENWVSTDAGKRFATYTNLDPGTYEFRVKAANKDGAWSGSSATLTIHVLPPFWKSWWFRTLMLTLAIGSAYAAFRVRMSGLRRQKNQLEQQVLARTDEIGQQNRLLLYQKHELEARRIEADTQRRDAERRHADAERQKQEVELQKENVELAHRNISILSEIGREMTATLDMETIMSTMYRHVQHLMDARMFGIGFCHEERGVIEFPFALDHGVRSQFYTRSMDEPRQLAVWCVSERREIFINNMATELPHYIGAAGARSLAPADLIDGTAPSAPVSVMYVPLIVKDRVMGVMSVQSIEANAYRRVHMDMLQTLAAHAAVALDNARAYRELEQTQARLLEQERKVRANTDELAEANRALQDNDERLRLAKQRAEEATRQKSEFLANMSHEMRTPLAGVIGMLGFALRDNRLQDATRDQILRGQANAQSLLAIINDLLDLSKIEAGKLNTENIDFALGAALDHVASLFEQQAAISGIGFDIELAPDLPRFVVGDPTRLRQVLVNLVGNAFKFTHQGAVRVSVQRCADVLPARGQVSMIRFSVQDTGIGISPAALARLFQKFEQADTTTTRRYGGTGLGLAICRQLVELMGGQISVDSVEGEGSSFSFVLPLADGVAPPAPSSAPLPPHSHRLKVLCAEDFPTNQIIIRTMLEELGHEVEMADDGLQAVQACVRTRHDLILMDGRMPQLDGASATRMIRAGGLERTPVRDRDLMIIALTANASEEDRARYLACGMDDFLTKPVDEAALHAQLARAIERQLARGIALEPMAPRRAPASAAELAALDELFGVAPGPAPQAPPGALNERVRAAFMADLPLRLAELNAARAAQDHEAAGRVLHGLSGSAAYLQADELRGWCGALSRAADRRQWDLLDAGLPRLHALLGVFADKVT